MSRVHTRSKTVTVRVSEDHLELLKYAAALELRTVSSLMEWLAAKHIEANYEQIVALHKLRNEETTE